MSNQAAGLRTSTFPEQVQLWFWCTCKAGHCKAGQPGLCISARRLHIQSRSRTLSLVARYRLAVAACPEAAGSAHAATRAQRRAPSSVLSESRMTMWFVRRSDDTRAGAQHAARAAQTGGELDRECSRGFYCSEELEAWRKQPSLCCLLTVYPQTRYSWGSVIRYGDESAEDVSELRSAKRRE